MFNHLHISDSRERRLVGAADLALAAVTAISRPFRRRPPARAPRRILLLRLERIGDLLMPLGAIAAVRARAPGAAMHLVVGSWNAPLAALVPGVDSVETLDVPWLSRETHGESAAGLVRRARAWRANGFDLGINFEPDIRTNVLLGLSGAARRVGFSTGGGAAALTDATAFDANTHTARNLGRLVDLALPAASAAASVHARLPVPDEARREARQLLERAGVNRLLVGVHAGAGRPVKMWHLERFAEVATRLWRRRAATIVLTGAADDRPFVDRIAAAMPSDVPRVDASGALPLPVLAAVLEQLGLFITCDTGPMHLAAAVGTPVVALFGPSNPERYGPLAERSRVITGDVWCRPCNRVRRPPERCTGRVPDCLDAIDVDAVYQAADDLLARRPRPESTSS